MSLRELCTPGDLSLTSPMLPPSMKWNGSEFSRYRTLPLFLPLLPISWLPYYDGPWWRWVLLFTLWYPWEGTRKWKITFMECLPSPKPWGNSTYPVRWVIFSPFYWGGNWYSGELSNLPMAIKPISCSVKIQTQLSPQSHMLSREDSLVLIMPILLKAAAKFQERSFLIHTLWQPVSGRP